MVGDAALHRLPRNALACHVSKIYSVAWKKRITCSGVQREGQTGRRLGASKAGGHPNSEVTKIKTR